MPGAMWNGTLSFGLVAVPVSMLSATRDLDVRFHQVDGETGERIRIRRICEADGGEVGWDEVGRGYELDGKLVTLTDDELAAAAPERTHTIEIEEFVELDAIDPALFDHTYFLVPGSDSEGSARAYSLLRDTMASTRQVAIGRVVLRSSEYLVGVREHDGLLTLTTMLFADELRGLDQIAGVPGEPGTGPATEVKRTEVAQAVKLIGAMTRDFEPGSYEDRQRTRLLALVEGKRTKARKPPTAKQEPEPEPPPDLMAALKRSLERARREQ